MAMFNADLAGGGSSVEIDGVAYDGDLKLEKTVRNVSLPNLPFNFYQGSAVVHDGEIHIFSSVHYKFNGTEWVEVSTLPISVSSHNQVVEYKGKIYLLVGKNFYVWDDSTWTALTPPPYYSNYEPIWKSIVCLDRIYIFGTRSNGSNSEIYYYENGTWTSTGYSIGHAHDSATFATDGEYMYIVGYGDGSLGTTNILKYNGRTSSANLTSSMPYRLRQACTEFVDGELHIYGTLTKKSVDSHYVYDYSFAHYVFRNYEWIQLDDIPHASGGGTSVLFDNCACIIGSYVDAYENKISSSLQRFLFAKNVTIIDKPIYEIS